VVTESVPTLETGINTLKLSGSTVPIHRLIVSALKTSGREAMWIDAGNTCSTYTMSSAGGKELLEKVSIVRAFTAFQHHNAVQKAEEHLKEGDLVVAPNFSALYRQGQITGWETEEMLEESWNKVRELQEELSLCVLIASQNIPDKIKQESDNRLKAVETDEGLRYSSTDFTQDAYRQGKTFQTTMSFWKSVA
jgi:hypothetical protein